MVENDDSKPTRSFPPYDASMQTPERRVRGGRNWVPIRGPGAAKQKSS